VYVNLHDWLTSLNKRESAQSSPVQNRAQLTRDRPSLKSKDNKISISRAPRCCGLRLKVSSQHQFPWPIRQVDVRARKSVVFVISILSFRRSAPQAALAFSHGATAHTPQLLPSYCCLWLQIQFKRRSACSAHLGRARLASCVRNYGSGGSDARNEIRKQSLKE
jgi:hypothetical protein